MNGTKTSRLNATADGKPAILAAQPKATVEGYQITSEANDDVVFVEFLASEPMGITITADSESTLKHTISADKKGPENQHGWVPVYEDDNANEKVIEAYRYTFQFYEPNSADSTGKSIHGTSGNKNGGYTWTATATDSGDAAKLISCNVATIDPPETISKASVSGNTITFTAENLKDGYTYAASVSLVREGDFDGNNNPTSEGTPVGRSEAVTEGNNTITLPNDYEKLVQSGKYHVVAHLERTENGGVTQDQDQANVRLSAMAVSSEKLTINNPNAPGAISEITHEYVGNGARQFTFPMADNKTTGYEMTATDANGNSIMIPCFDAEGNVIANKKVDAFAVPVTYPLKDMKDQTKLTMVPDGSRLKLGETYNLTFTPYHEETDSVKRVYGPSKTIEVEFTAPQPVTAAVTVGQLDQVDVWKKLDSQPDDPTTRYVAQEHLVTLETETKKLDQPETTSIAFTANAARSMEIVAIGDQYAETDAEGTVTNNKTKTFTAKASDPSGVETLTWTEAALPLSAGEHMFTVTTVAGNGDANTQVFVFTVDGADIQFTVDSHSFVPSTPGSNSGTFNFEALLEDGAKVTQIGTITGLNLTPSGGKVIWTGDPAVTPTVLAKEDEKDIAWRYIVPITVEDANGFTATQALSYDVYDPVANVPSQMELAVYPGTRLSAAVTDAKVSVTTTGASGVVTLPEAELAKLVEFTSSNESVLTVGTDGKITAKSPGAATITATYKISKPVNGINFKPRASLSVTVVSGNEKPAPSLRVDSVTADSVTVELGAVNAPSVTLNLYADTSNTPAATHTLNTGLMKTQTDTFTGLTPGSGYRIEAVAAGSYYSVATVRATTDLLPPAGEIYTVTYAQDGADGGSVPVDPNAYAQGATVKLLASATPLTKNGVEVLGFSTAPDGGGTKLLYADMTEDSAPTFIMGSANVTLYPVWTAENSGGNGGNGGGGGGGGGGSTGNKTKEPVISGGQGWNAVSDALSDPTPGETLAVDMNGATQVPAEVLKAIAGKDVTVKLDMGGGATWIIQGEDLPAGASLAALELGVNTQASAIPADVIDAVSGEKSATQLELTHNGPFNIKLNLQLDLGKSHAGRWANLYYYNPTQKALEFRAQATIGADGLTQLPFDHASSYAVIIDDAPHGQWENPFTDVADGNWFYEAVKYVHTYGIMTGTTATTFDPDLTTSRGMIVAMLYRLEGSPETLDVGPVFKDVAQTQYYAPAIAWASAHDIVGGYGEGRFGPDDPVTREQLTAMLFRFAESQGLDVSAAADLSNFADTAAISDWAGKAMAWAVNQGILSGKGDGVLDPQGNATRAEAAAMLTRLRTGSKAAEG